MYRALRSLLLVLLCTGLARAKDIPGPATATVPDFQVRVNLPGGWLLRYQEPVQYFFVNSLAGSIRSLRFTKVRREESNEIDVALSEYRRVQGISSEGRQFSIDDRGQSKTGYYIHYTVNHPRLGVSKGFIGCSALPSSRYLVATGEGTQARIGNRKGLKPTDAEMLEMRKVWEGLEF